MILDSTPGIRIGEVARTLNISTSTLRLYEDLGIILPSRKDSGERMYSLEDIDWLQKINIFFVETRIGPTALARLMRLMPTHAMRQRRTGKGCKVHTNDKICWQVLPALRELCRKCPAYLEKDAVLDFGSNFQIVLHDP